MFQIHHSFNLFDKKSATLLIKVNSPHYAAVECEAGGVKNTFVALANGRSTWIQTSRTIAISSGVPE